MGSGFGYLFLGLAAQDFIFPQPTLGILKKGSDSQSLLLPSFPGLVPLPSFTLPSILRILTPPPSFRDRCVLCPGEWNFLVTSHHHWSFHAKSHTHTFPPPISGQVPGKGTDTSLFPPLPLSLSLLLPLFSPLPSHPPLLSTEL